MDRRANRADSTRILRGRSAARRTFLRQPRLKAATESPGALIYGFLLLIVIGTGLLMLPVASAEGQATGVGDALFTATSAVCVTGLVVVPTGDYWSGFGQAVILALIQVGGFGFMAGVTLILLAFGQAVGLQQRLMLERSMGQGRTGGLLTLVRRLALFTIAAEGLGLLVFFVRFCERQTPLEAAWYALFHTVSSFNNAGFDIFGGFTSLQPFEGDPVTVLVTAVLIILGGISFVVLQDVLKYRRFGRLAFDSKIVLATTGALLFLGTVVILGTETLNASTLGTMAWPERILGAFFHSVTSRTAGFSTVDTSAMAAHSLLFTMFLMFVGGAVGSTAGGIKVNTFGLLVATMVGTLRGRQHPGAFGREFTDPQVRRALTVVFLSLGLVLATTFCLSLSEGLPLLSLLFESVSAFGTVGLTTGVTPDLSPVGKLVITLTMFAGRLGPLTLVAGLLKEQMPLRYRLPTDTVRMG